MFYDDAKGAMVRGEQVWFNPYLRTKISTGGLIEYLTTTEYASGERNRTALVVHFINDNPTLDQIPLDLLYATREECEAAINK